jgi:AcrR family transcriptional regulator
MASTPASKRERTRAALVAAAAALIAERGYERTSLEAVAARAGMSRGAIYGNFTNRDALFLAVAETLWRPVAPSLPPGASFAEQMRALGKAVAAQATARRRMAVGAVSFQLYALNHAPMRERLLEANRRIYAEAAERLAEAVPADRLPLAPDLFVKAVHALIEGLMLTHFLTPELIGEAEIEAAFELLAKAGADPIR